MKRLVLVILAASTGCATTAEPREPLWSAEPPPAPVGKVDLKTFARQFPRSVECEKAAREIRAASADQGWGALEACVARGDFMLLGTVLRDWGKEIRDRPDGAVVLARIIAMRGGDVPDDLKMIHEHKVPLFSLADALAAPNVYEGHYVVLRARLKEVRADGNQVTARLDETALATQEWYHPEGLAFQTTRELASHARYEGPPPGYYAEPARFGSNHRQSSVYVSRRFDNVSVDTGLAALVKMPRTDPFLEPDQEMILLARFDGVRETDSDDGASVPLLTLVSYSAPGALQVQ